MIEFELFHLSRSTRSIFLLSICCTICLVHIALILELFANSSTEFIRTNSPKLICSKKRQCPNNISRFSIHIDQNPEYPNATYVRSSIFATILQTVYQSKYYTNDSNGACVHLAPVDTIDRDRRSKRAYFLFFAEQRLRFYPEWSDPNKIHIIFNHYTGTWPSYRRELDFRVPPQTILALTSFTWKNYDCSSHISFPLFHADYPWNITFPSQTREILLSFKGKSYSDVQHHRTFFRHLHNGNDILIEYTDEENSSSNSVEYLRLLSRSKFCLVPNGRRLYSYRFLECLQYACIPVITTENNESILLPFSEIIDWSDAVIVYSNRSLSLMIRFLRQINEIQQKRMQQRASEIWTNYFSSIPRIVSTFLDILHDRFV